jgi:hypothetical protein
MRVATIEYAITPVAFKHEQRDCAVRALRIAAGITYERAHAMLAAYGRRAKRATSNNTVKRAAENFRLHAVNLNAHLDGWPTLAKFVREHRTGSYVLRVNTHFLAVRDGVVYNWTAKRNGARTRVKAAWSNVPEPLYRVSGVGSFTLAAARAEADRVHRTTGIIVSITEVTGA